VSPFMAPSITSGAVISSRRRPATNVRLFQGPSGTRPITRSPRGPRPERRAIVVFTHVLSMKTRLDVSSRRCCRIQCRRARATSSRCCSAARRLFFEADAMSLQKTPQRAAAARYSPLMHGHDELFEGPVRLFSGQRQNLVRILLQRRLAAAARLRLASALPPPRLIPLDRRADTDFKTLRSLTPRCSPFNRFDHTLPQILRTSPGHGDLPASRITPTTLPLRDPWEAPIQIHREPL